MAESKSAAAKAAQTTQTTQMLINYVPGEECRVAVVEGGKLEEFHAERASSISRVGNIYVGVVTNVEPSIQAAFVDFGVEHHGFLHVSDIHPRYFPGEDEDTTERVGRKTPRRERPPIQKCFRRGDEVVVQVLKEGVGTKGPTLTSYLSIPGRFLVMMPQMDKVGVSRKVEDEDQRRAMRQILDQLDLPEGFGFIVRTAGMDRNKTELKRDLSYLQRLWKDMEARHSTKTKGGPRARLLYSESDLLVRALRDMLGPEIEEVIIDNELALARAARFLKIVAPRSKVKLMQYEGQTPLFHAFGVEQQIALMHAREVPLPGGGRLVIDETEALVAIDVNSGKMRDARDAETNAYRTNVEAVEEICRQLKLRDLGGIVINDLIDMRHASHRKDIEQRFRDRLKRDRARSTTLAISDFGILEMTRQRMRGSHESVHFVDCPTCRGRGMVQKPDSISADALRNLAAVLDHENVARVEMVVSPRVASELLSGRRKSLNQLERRSGKHVDVRVSETVALDRITFYAYDASGADIDVETLPKQKAPSNLKVWELGIKGEDEWASDPKEEEAPAEPELSPAEQAELADLPSHPIEFDEVDGAGAPAAAGSAGEQGGDGAPRRGRRRRGRRGRGGGGEGGEPVPNGAAPAAQRQSQPAAPQPQRNQNQRNQPARQALPPMVMPAARAEQGGRDVAPAGGPPMGGPVDGQGGERPEGEGGRRRRRRRRRGGRGRTDGMPGEAGVQGPGPGGGPEVHEHEMENGDAVEPAMAPAPIDPEAPRGDSWDLEPAALPPLPRRPVLRPVANDVIDEEEEGEAGAPIGAAASGESHEGDANGAGPNGEGGNGDGTGRRRRRRRRGRGGRGGGEGGNAPEAGANAGGAPVQAAAPSRAPQQPQAPRPQPQQRPSSPRPPAPRPPAVQPVAKQQVTPVREDRPVRLGGGYQKKAESSEAPAVAAAPTVKPVTVTAAPTPEPKPGALAAAKRFLYSTRRKLAPGEIKKLPRE